jgi:hypothetical protein
MHNVTIQKPTRPYPPSSFPVVIVVCGSSKLDRMDGTSQDPKRIRSKTDDFFPLSLLFGSGLHLLTGTSHLLKIGTARDKEIVQPGIAGILVEHFLNLTKGSRQFFVVKLHDGDDDDDDDDDDFFGGW